MSNRMNLVKLKIKSKHLAAEPAIIRHEEKKIQGWERTDLQFHRIWDVRNESRATQLAIAYLKGKDINTIESTRRSNEDYKHLVVLKRVVSMVTKYSNTKPSTEDISKWFWNLKT